MKFDEMTNVYVNQVPKRLIQEQINLTDPNVVTNRIDYFGKNNAPTDYSKDPGALMQRIKKAFPELDEQSQMAMYKILLRPHKVLSPDTAAEMSSQHEYEDTQINPEPESSKEPTYSRGQPVRR